MYKILGIDQKEYGPVSTEQILQWIKEGRLQSSSQAQTEGTSEWKPLSSFPEFAGALSAKAAQTPPPPLGNAEALAQQIIGRGYSMDPGHCFSRSWDLFTRHFWLLVGASFVIAWITKAIPLFSGVLSGGLFLLFLKLIRGENAEFGDAFSGFGNFLELFLVGLVVNLLTAVGFALLIVPGIFLAVAWLFAVPLVADRKLDFWTAMEVSRLVICAHWLDFFLLALLSLLVCLVGVIVFCLGFYIALPIAIGAIAYAYEDVFATGRSNPT